MLRQVWSAFACLLATAVVIVIVLIETDFRLFEWTDDVATLANGLEEPVNNWRNLSDDEIASLSKVGRRLFLLERANRVPESLDPTTKKTYTILIWKHGPHIEKRFIYWYGTKWNDPFADCSVSNCEITYDERYLSSADAVFFHLRRTNGVASLPHDGARNPEQRWVFLTDESPHNTFIDQSDYNELKNYNGIFNWSMSYRMDSDVPVPYGRTLLLSKEEKNCTEEKVNYAKGKRRLVGIVGSKCYGTNQRWSYVKELRKHVRVDVFGRCGRLKACRGNFTMDCPLVKYYKFYLAFENSNCREYVTEKTWWSAYAKGVVPVIMGVSGSDAAKLLPPGSYIRTEEFASPADLARYLRHLNRSDVAYNRYFEWKKEFKVVNEHGYFVSPVYHYCRLCEALNYNDKSHKVYNDLDSFWSVKNDCSVSSSSNKYAVWNTSPT